MRRYLGPAAFLLTVTVAVILVRAGLDSGRSHHSSQTAVTPPPTRVSATTTAPTSKRPARRYWTVRAGDTFGVIAVKTGVSVATIQQLNPKVSSTSLFIGERIRIR